MPWTGASFAPKNHHLTPPQAAHAARIANAILARGAPESTAIRVANSHFMQRRDVGGGVDPTQGGVGGITPSAQTMSPLQQGLMQQYASLPTEKLQELAARAGGSPQGAMIRAALQRKLTQPNAQAQPPQQPVGQAPPAMQRGGALPRYAAGGPTILPPMGVGTPVTHAPMNGPDGFTSEDIGPVGRAALTAAGLVPGPVGLVASALNAGIKGINVAALDQNLSQVGQPTLSPGQVAGAFAPFGNNYGSGNLPGELGDLGYASSGIPASAVSGGREGMGAAGLSSGPGTQGGGGFSPGAASGADGGGGYARGGPMLRRAFGGEAAVPQSMATPWWTRSEAHGDDGGAGGGFLAGTTGGRTDAVKTTAPSGAYILPADVISGLGDGNSLAGARVMDEVLRSGPYGTPQPGKSRGMGPPRPPPAYRQGQGFKSGGVDGGGGKPQPVALSHGEYSVSPADVLRIGRGNMKEGWKELDRFVLEQRAKHIKKLKSLPGPVGAAKNAA